MRFWSFQSPMATICLMLITFFDSFSVMAAQAESVRPFLVSNQSPFSSIQGLPFTPDAQVLANKKQAFTFDLAWASHSYTQSQGSEALSVDGESVQLNLIWKVGLRSGFEFGVLVPFLHHGGGLMDSGIKQYHSILGLPQGGRDVTPNNQINYRYGKSINGQFNLLVDESPSGANLGDIRLFLSKQLKNRQQDGYNLVLQNEIKSTTGKLEDWSGNEALAVSSALAYDSAFYHTEETHWQAFGHAGLRYSEKGNLLPEQQKQGLAFAGFGLVMQWFSLQLQTQFDVHSAIYESDLAGFGPAVQITFGGNYLTEKGIFSFSIGEDILPETAPDVVFKLAWDQRW